MLNLISEHPGRFAGERIREAAYCPRGAFGDVSVACGHCWRPWPEDVKVWSACPGTFNHIIWPNTTAPLPWSISLSGTPTELVHSKGCFSTDFRAFKTSILVSSWLHQSGIGQVGPA